MPARLFRDEERRTKERDTDQNESNDVGSKQQTKDNDKTGFEVVPLTACKNFKSEKTIENHKEQTPQRDTNQSNRIMRREERKKRPNKRRRENTKKQRK